jgi:AGCS family alanine or glycine:cation symporter
VQSNTICAAWEHAFGIDHTWMGIGLTVTTLAIIFGGIHRIARVSSWLVPIMAVGYIVLALGVVIVNITELPSVIGHIVSSAFGWEQAVGGGMGAAVMQGIKRGLFSNEAGMGSAPNVAATATVTHPAKQGFIQALGVFTDTLVICTCTAFIILVSDPSPDASLNGIQLTQAAFTAQVGQLGSVFVAIAILLFAFSSIIGNYYYGESNIRFISRRPIYLWAYRILVGAMVMCGAVMSLDLAWSLADVTMGLMTVCNLIAIVLLARQALWLLRDYTDKRRRGIDSPTFHREEMPEEMRHDIECWD